MSNATIEPAQVTKTKSWRDVLPVHPAADMFPLMSQGELKELAEDIRKNGIQTQIVYWQSVDGKISLLDGRNRLDAMEFAGILGIDNRSRFF